MTISEQQFITAAEKGNLNRVKKYLENKGNVHAQEDEALREASWKGHTEIVRLLLEWEADVHAKDDAALRWASGYGHTEIVRLLLEHEAKVHARDDYALRLASAKGYTEIVRVLMEHIVKKELKGEQEFWDALVMYVLGDVKRNRNSEWFHGLLNAITTGDLKIPKDYLQLFQIANLPH